MCQVLSLSNRDVCREDTGRTRDPSIDRSIGSDALPTVATPAV